VAPAEIVEGTARLAGEAQARRKAFEVLEAKLGAQAAEQLIAAHPSGAIVHTVEGGMQAAKLLAAALVARGRNALIASSDGDRVHLCFARPAGNGPSMSSILKNVLPIIRGKGGGSAEIAQGSGDGSRLAEALAVARAQVDGA
jgi:alanyl-tRNA synthetase